MLSESSYWPGADRLHALRTATTGWAQAMHDALGNVILLGSPQRAYGYSDWGAQTLDVDQVGFQGLDRSRWKGALRFAPGGVELYFMRHRWYEPRTGRFLSPDPLGFVGGPNLYAFAAGDPVNFADPSGTRCVLWGWFLGDPSHGRLVSVENICDGVDEGGGGGGASGAGDTNVPTPPDERCVGLAVKAIGGFAVDAFSIGSGAGFARGAASLVVSLGARAAARRAAGFSIIATTRAAAAASVRGHTTAIRRLSKEVPGLGAVFAGGLALGSSEATGDWIAGVGELREAIPFLRLTDDVGRAWDACSARAR